MPREQTLASWLVRQKGLREGGRILAFIVTWGIALEDLGVESMSVEQYAEYWGEHERTSYRDLDRFRQAFSEYGFRSPAGLLAVVGGHERVPSTTMDQVVPS